MWRAFQSAAFVSVDDVVRATRPIAVRCWLTSSRTLAVRSCRGVPQLAPWTQSPTAAAEAAGASGDGDEPSANTAASASPTASVRMSDFNIRFFALPLSVRMTTVSKDGFDQPNRMELLDPVL